MTEAAFGIERFMMSSVGCRVLCQEFRAYGSLFSIFGLLKYRNTKTGLEIDIPFFM